MIAYSSGNHAQGVALAASRHGLPCVIVMPSDAPKVKIANTRAYGAAVRQDLFTLVKAELEEIGEGCLRRRACPVWWPTASPA